MSYLDLLDAYLLNDIFKMARILYIKECHEKHQLINSSRKRRILYWATNHILNCDSTYDKVHGDIITRYTSTCTCNHGEVHKIDDDANQRQELIDDYLSALQEYDNTQVQYVYNRKKNCSYLFKGTIISYMMIHKYLNGQYMPTHQGSDTKGTYYQWGQTGKKYYYKTSRGEQLAKNKANKQGMAISISKNK